MGPKPRAKGGMSNGTVRRTRSLRAAESRGTAPKTKKSLNYVDVEQEEGPNSENSSEEEDLFEPPHTFKCTVQITCLGLNQGSIEELKKSIQIKFLIMVVPFETVLKARRRAITMFLNFAGLSDDDSIDETHFSNFFTDEYGEVSDNYKFGHVFGKSSQVFMTYSGSSKDITQPIEKIPLPNSHTIHFEESAQFTQQNSATAPTKLNPSSERAFDAFEQISSELVVSPSLSSISEVPIAHSAEDLQDIVEPQSLIGYDPPSPTISKAVSFREPLHSLSPVSERNGEHDYQSVKLTNLPKLSETNTQVSNSDWHTPTPEACDSPIIEMRSINNLQESDEQEEVTPSFDTSKENMLHTPASPCYESDSSIFSIWDNLSNEEFDDETIIKEHLTDDYTSKVLLSDSDDEKIDLTHNSPPTNFNISKSFDGESSQDQDQPIPAAKILSTVESSGEEPDRPQNVTHRADSEIPLERESSPAPQVEYSYGPGSFGSKVDSSAQSFVSEPVQSPERDSIAKLSQEAERKLGDELAHNSLSMIDSDGEEFSDSGSGSSDSSGSESEKESSDESFTQSTQAILAEPLQVLESKAIAQESVPEATQSTPEREHLSGSESEEGSSSDSESESEEESSSASESKAVIELDWEPPREDDTESHQLPKIALPAQELFAQLKPETEEEGSSDSGSDSENSSESETEMESELIQEPISQPTQKFDAEPMQELGSVTVSPQPISEPKGSSESESGSENPSDSEGSSGQESGISSDEEAKTEPTIASISNLALSIPKTTSPKMASSQRANAPPMARHSLKRHFKDEPIETPVPLGQIHPNYYKSIKPLPSKDKYFDEVMVKKFKNSTQTPSILSQNSLVLTSIDLNPPSASGSENESGSVSDSSSDVSSEDEQVKSQVSNKSMLLDFLKS